jgi:AcrR family transcriptional regulator
VARELLEDEGEEGMSMRRIAARLGVRAPSLYKHVPDKQALENGIIASVLDEQAALGGSVLAAARAAGEHPLLPMMAAYRRWALDHPALYALNVRGPLDRGGLVRSAELRGSAHVLEAAEGNALTSMTVWALTHGLIDLELQGRMPPGYAPEALLRRGVAALRATPASVPVAVR